MAPIICFAFGFVCLVIVVGPGDGTWILYAREIVAGHRIYSELGLNQQPLFPLLSVAAERISPGGIMAGKLPFFAVLAAHVLLITKICARIADTVPTRAVLVLATFFTAIHFEAFRFDDYHALAECAVLASFYLALLYAEKEVPIGAFALAQGVLAAAGFLVRVNEGLAIAGASVIVFLTFGGVRGAARALLLFAFGAAGVLALVLLLVHEGPFTWFQQTVISASSAKGGGALFAVPWRTILNAFKELLRPTGLLFAFVVLIETLALRRRTADEHLPALVGGQAALLIFVSMLLSYGNDPLIPLAAIGLLLSISAMALLFLIWLRLDRNRAWQPKGDLALCAYPCAMFFTGALSTGGEIYGLYFPLALAIMLTVLLLREPLGRESQRSTKIAFFTFLALIAAIGFRYRAERPYSWLTYHVNPMLADYQVENDPSRGLHVITRELRDLIMPVCTAVTPGKTLLSLPYSFANYYCGIPIWKGNVQSFFDTSTASNIVQIRSELEQGPPDFIFYQRQLAIMLLHERIFRGGSPLPQRALDDLIVRKVQSGEWRVVYRSDAYAPSRWYLISTHRLRRSHSERVERGS